MDVRYNGEYTQSERDIIDAHLYDLPEGTDFLVCDEDGRYEEIREHIEETLWAFNPAFLTEFTSVELSVDMIAKVQELYEDANPLLHALVADNIETLIEEAITLDGAGHFLSPYDGQEYAYTILDDKDVYYYILG